MFLSKRESGARSGGSAALGQVTVQGNAAGVWLESERRGVTVYAPAGYHWAPALGEELLVLKAGERGEKLCAVGVPVEDTELEAGEVRIKAGNAAVTLSPDGRVEVTGRLTVNGADVVLQQKAEEGAAC